MAAAAQEQTNNVQLVQAVYHNGLAEIDAPIILDMAAEDAAITFKTFVKRNQVENVLTAEREARRLWPFFQAYGTRLSKALDENESLVAPQEWSRVKALLDPVALHQLFVAAAENFRNTISSAVAIVPDSLFTEHEYHDLLPTEAGSFNKVSKYNKRPFRFGFFQTFEKNDSGRKLSSTGFSVLGLDPDILARIKPHGAESMIKSLQTLITAANHDALHHLNALIINPSIAYSFKSYEGTPLYKDWYQPHMYTGFFGGDKHPKGLESWSVLSYGKSLEDMMHSEYGQSVAFALKTYFDELERITGELKKDDSISRHELHATIDYLGTMMGFTVMRMGPFENPFMQYCLYRMEEIDTENGDALLLDTFMNRFKDREEDIFPDAETENNGNKVLSKEEEIELRRIFLEAAHGNNDLAPSLIAAMKRVSPSFKKNFDGMSTDNFINQVSKIADSDTKHLRMAAKRQDTIRSAFQKDIVAFLNKGPQKWTDAEYDLAIEMGKPMMSRIYARAGGDYTRKVVENCEAAGTPLLSKEGTVSGYKAVKKLQLVKMAAPLAHLFTKPKEQNDLAEAQARVEQIDIEMLSTLAKTIHFRPSKIIDVPAQP